MKTAMMSVPPLGGVDASNHNTAAVESAVDAYATRILEQKSPSGTFVDASLGPYVTALLRCSGISSREEVRSIAEFESLVELLEDQCNMDSAASKSALLSIADAVCTGTVPDGHDNCSSTTVGPYSGVGLDSFRLLGSALEEVEASVNRNEPDRPQIGAIRPNSAGGPSPLKPDNLIPGDLLGALDDPSPQIGQRATVPMVGHSVAPIDEAFPPLGAQQASPAPSKKHPRGKKASKTQSKDLTAALFRPARPRQNSIESEDTSPKLQPEANPIHMPDSCTDAEHFQHRLSSAVEILLSMSPDLGEDAAVEAAMMANTDFNLAQYIVDAALTAPPVCRHMLHDGCYRSDCQFSHDVEGHTCLFWLRGRCGKGPSCRFLHGFNPKLLDGINTMMNSDPNHAESFHSAPSHVLSSSLGATTSQSGRAASWEPMGSAFSFASVATMGYQQSQFSSPTRTESVAPSIPTVRIPQDLWNPNENRDASAFHIPDPIERYHRVSSRVHRTDVVDLHFQSTKTFSVVLSQILPQKLSQLEEVWVVTGTGHHVGSKTHQRGGGALEASVVAWLRGEGYNFAKGRDRNGMGGALLVRR